MFSTESTRVASKWDHVSSQFLFALLLMGKLNKLSCLVGRSTLDGKISISCPLNQLDLKKSKGLVTNVNHHLALVVVVADVDSGNHIGATTKKSC